MLPVASKQRHWGRWTLVALGLTALSGLISIALLIISVGLQFRCYDQPGGCAHDEQTMTFGKAAAISVGVSGVLVVVTMILMILFFVDRRRRKRSGVG